MHSSSETKHISYLIHSDNAKSALIFPTKFTMNENTNEIQLYLPTVISTYTKTYALA